MFFNKSSKKAETGAVQTIESPCQEELMRQDRINELFSSPENPLRRDVLGSTSDKQLVPFQGGSSELTNFSESSLETVRAENYLKGWQGLIHGHNWSNTDLQGLANDAFEGLFFSLEQNRVNQVRLQTLCLTRSIVRDFLESCGFKTQEVRFAKNTFVKWPTSPRSRVGISETEKDAGFRLAMGPNAQSQQIRLYSFNDASMRISGKAFRARAMIQQLPREIVEDVWIADLIESKSDPLLIFQVGGYSYAICSWEE